MQPNPLDRYMQGRDTVLGHRPDKDADQFGDWCVGCADRGDPRPVRYPTTVDADGRATYRCGKCGETWTCWYATGKAS